MNFKLLQWKARISLDNCTQHFYFISYIDLHFGEFKTFKYTELSISGFCLQCMKNLDEMVLFLSSLMDIHVCVQI